MSKLVPVFMLFASLVNSCNNLVTMKLKLGHKLLWKDSS